MRKRKRIYSTVLLVSFICLIIGGHSSKAGPNQPDETTEPPKRDGTVTDIDGNTYPTVMIGTQLWMAENLRVTRYNNGDAIPNVTDAGAWMSLNSGAYCEYDNNIAKVATYGRLYNWFSATDVRNLAPAGWHVPSDAEWQTLVDFLGATG